MKIWSYLVYIIAYEFLTIGGTGYVVFVLGYSGWWFLLGGLFSAGCWKPERWSALWDDRIANQYRLKDEQKAKA